MTGSTGTAALYDVDPDDVSARVLACPAVAGLSGGPFGTVATYLPGRSVAGIRVGTDTVEVHVVVRYGPTVIELVGQIRQALTGHTLDRPVDIVVEDVADPVVDPPVGPDDGLIGDSGVGWPPNTAQHDDGAAMSAVPPPVV